MPGAPRPNKKAMKIAYDILSVPKELRQDGKDKPSKATLEEWAKELEKAR
jgi:hypothetical protein